LLFSLNDSTEFTAEAARVTRTVLPGGVRVLVEEVPGAPSVSIAASVAVGSRDESGVHFGSTHFLEHLLFKGTGSRNQKDISIAFDSVGGTANAATAKEYTSYYARVQNSALPLALDVIIDMFTSAKLENSDFDIEKTVILEELAMNEDDPEDVAHEALAENLLPSHELGRPIGGTEQTIKAVSRDSVFEYYKTHYIPSNLVITVAGGVSTERVLELVGIELAKVGWDLPGKTPNPRRAQFDEVLDPAKPFAFIDKDVSQANILLGYQSIRGAGEQRYALGIMNTILGGGMSSRMYQQIREERGLAYSTYSYQQGYADAGYFGLYAGSNPEHAAEVIGLMKDCFSSIANDGVLQSEYDLALGNITGGLALRYESSMARMNRLLSAEIGTGEYLSVAEVMERFKAVTLPEIQLIAQKILSNPSSLIVVGKGLAKLERLS